MIPECFEMVQDDGQCKKYLYEISLQDSTDVVKYELLVWNDGLYSLKKSVYKVESFETGNINNINFVF